MLFSTGLALAGVVLFAVTVVVAERPNTPLHESKDWRYFTPIFTSAGGVVALWMAAYIAYVEGTTARLTLTLMAAAVCVASIYTARRGRNWLFWIWTGASGVVVACYVVILLLQWLLSNMHPLFELK